MTFDHVAHIADTIHALIDPMHHIEPSRHNGVWLTRRHTSDHDSLLGQLRELTDPANSSADTDGTPNRSVPCSRPAARLDAIAILSTIETETARILRNARIERKGDLDDNLTALVGVASKLQSAHPCRYPRPKMHLQPVCLLARTVASWAARARVALGWDTPATRPPAPCPVPECQAPTTDTSGLRARPYWAWCITCGGRWEREDFERIIRHVNRHRAAVSAYNTIVANARSKEIMA